MSLPRPHRSSPDGGQEPSKRRIVIGVVLGAFVALVAFTCWLGVRALEVKSNLEQARTQAQQTKDSLLKGETEAARRAADSAAGHARAARDAAHSVPWTVASSIPWLGSPFDTGREITDVVLGLAADVLRPAADAGTALAPDRLVQGNRVDVEMLRQQSPALDGISSAAARLDHDARAIGDPAYPSAIRSARTDLQAQTREVAGLLTNTALAAHIAPAMMGADGPRTYLMAFQTNAEARGTGGLLGGFGILRFTDGTPAVDALGTNRELIGASADVDLGREFAEQYGFTNPFTDFRNSNISSHFPNAARIWKSMWDRQNGTDVDGVIAVDPIALSHILAVVGSVKLSDGEVVTSDNVVELTESTAYERFPDDQLARKAYLQQIANAVVGKMTGPVRSPRQLLDALGTSVSQRRIAVWDANPAIQEQLERTPLGHAIPIDEAPYAEVVVNNLGGNKMDYYLQRKIEYAAEGCSGPTRSSTVTIGLKNATPDGRLSEFVAASPGLTKDVPIQLVEGTNLASVKVIATQGATLVSALSNGQRVPVLTGTERGRPTFEVQVAIPPGKAGELSFRLTEPTAPGAARVPVQPLLDDVVPTVSVPECIR